MSESLTALYLTNPALASALRRQQYGQQLAQTGTDTSPTSWAGALARLANAYVGQREVGRADSDIKGLGDAQMASRAAADADEARLLYGTPKPAGSAPAPVPLPQAPVDPSAATAPLTDRQNNPGALRFAGQTGATNVNGFAAFPSREAGMAAADAQLGLYGSRDGINTLAGAISKWAPPNENDTRAYIARVSQATGIDPNAPIDLTDQAVRQKILPAMFSVEGGPKSIAGGTQIVANATPGTATDAGTATPGVGSGTSPLVSAYLPQQAPVQASGGGVVPPAIAAIPEPMQRAQAIQALALKYAASPDPYLKAKAPLLMQMAGQLLQVNKFVPDTVGGVSGQRNVMTGEWKPMVAGTGRPATDVHGNLIELPPGGGAPRIIAPNASGVTGNTPEANAMRIMAELAGKMRDGTATPQERDSYNTAANTYQQFQKTVTTPGQEVGVGPTRPLPAGMPAPGASVAPKPDGTSAPNAPAPTAATQNGEMVTKPADIGKVAAQAQAQAQGAESGKQAALTGDRMVRLGTEASQGLGTIDSALTQVRDASKGGITAGYFAPWVATAAAAAKSMGINLDPANISPDAVSNVQAARKSLALVSGSILRNILGPETPITDAKLQQYIHATPGIETDPQALEKILGWARSQFVFNHDMAMDAMRAADPQTGMVPPGWQAQFFRQKGSFGPIYNPLSGEMAQPKGQGPAAEAPAATPKAEPSKAPSAPIPAPAAAFLRANPNLAPAFDSKYGPGSAAKILGTP